MKCSSPLLSDSSSQDHQKGKFLFWLFIVYLSTFVFGGLLRYLFAIGEVPNLLYVRDGLAISLIAYVFFRRLVVQQWIHGPIAILTLLLGVHFFQSLFIGASIFQALFGLKMYVPVVLGFAIWPVIATRRIQTVYVMLFFFLVSVLGVFLNYFYGLLPWEAFEYETAFGRVESTKEWWIQGGIRRLSGFSRGSPHVAAIIGITGGFALAIMKTTLIRIFIALIGFIAILLTTSKGMLLAFSAVSLWLVISTLRDSLTLGKLILISFVLFTISLPLSSLVVDFGNARDLPYLLSSFWDRLDWMWPNAFGLLDSPISAVIGNGLGAIGTPQLYGSQPALINAGDNLFVYLYVTFGFMSLMYLLFPVFMAFRLSNHNLELKRCYIAILAAIIGYGVTTNMIEQPFIMVVYGCLCAVAIESLFCERTGRMREDNHVEG